MTTLAFGLSNMFGPDTLIILLVVTIFFGAKRLPELARAFGQSIREFQKGKDGATETPAEPHEIRNRQS
jgi:sec-independent protein translocase protein TatA